MTLENGFSRSPELPNTVQKTADELSSKDSVWDDGEWKQVLGVAADPGGTGSRVLIKGGAPRFLEEPSDTLEVKG